ncbi:hypothetical protein MHTCC0001_14800 [Flavobacteriaceae bacterium MHTCC 0001]
MKWKQLNAGALQFTMYIVVVVALLLGSFILFIHTHKKLELASHFTRHVVHHSQKGINDIMSQNIALQDTVEIVLNDELEDYGNLKLKRDYWGVFEKAVSIASIKNKTFKRVGLIGGKQPLFDRTALFLADKNRPLVVVGDALIKGTGYLPKQGIRTGNISGHSYYGNQLIYGKSKYSKPHLPSLSVVFVQQIKNIQEKLNQVKANQFISLSKGKTHQNSFLDPSKVVYNVNSINLSQVKLIGNIIVQSRTKIIVDISTVLEDVILIAPEIEVKQGVTGIFQAFATKKITVGEGCQLKYPSALVTIEKPSVGTKVNKTSKSPFISIGKRSKIEGTLIFMGPTENYNAQVFIDEGVQIKGEVYCDKNLELLGVVNGSVFTSSLVANQSGSVYQNHLYNGKIDVEQLPMEYIGLPFSNTKKGIAKWLY